MQYIVHENHLETKLSYGKLAISPDEEAGYRPFELFVSSLAGCSGSLLRTLLRKKRITYRTLTLDVSAVRNSAHANRIEQLTFNASIDGDLTEDQGRKIADLVVKNCGMIQSVVDAIDIRFTVVSRVGSR